MVSQVVLPFDGDFEGLRAKLAAWGFEVGERPNAPLFAQGFGVTIHAYRTGKLLLAGARAEEWARELAQEVAPADAPARGRSALPFPHIGSDESGKGDYFGPLCVASVSIPTDAIAATLVKKGVRDSKRVPNAEAGPLASLVRSLCPHAIRVLAPPRYNDVYARSRGLNALLATLHAECIEELLGAIEMQPVLVDQFADAHVLSSRLGPIARAVRVEQAPRAEEDLAVAAASLVARAEFLAGIAALEVEHGARLPLGAGAPTLAAARAIGAQGGKAALGRVAKLHFATTDQALR